VFLAVSSAANSHILVFVLLVRLTAWKLDSVRAYSVIITLRLVTSLWVGRIICSCSSCAIYSRCTYNWGNLGLIFNDLLGEMIEKFVNVCSC